MREKLKFAVVSGKLVIQCNSDQSEKLAAELQGMIDSSSALRRRGDVTTREAGDLAELKGRDRVRPGGGWIQAVGPPAVFPAYR